MECQVRDIAVHYEQFGTGRPLIALHGWPADHHSTVHDLEPLFVGRPGWRRIYLDLPGMGLTRGPDWLTHQDQMLEVVLEFIDAVAPGERFVVAGVSYGGYLARGVVHRRAGQMDGLLLNVPVVNPTPDETKLPQHRVLREDPEYLAALGPEDQLLHEIIVVQSMELLRESHEFLLPAFARADRDFLARLHPNYAFSFDVDSPPERLEAPCLFLTGRFDQWEGYDAAYHLLADYPRATFATLDRTGHVLFFEQKPLFKALASEWLDRVEEYANQRH